MINDEWEIVGYGEPEQNFGDMFANAVMKQESAFNPRAVSSAGAQGLMQLMPATGREVAAKLGMESFDPYDPEQNMQVGKAYLNQMYDMFGDERLALAAYNAGPGNVQKAIKAAGTNNPEAVLQFLPDETKNYVPKVMSNYGKPAQAQQVPPPQEEEWEIVDYGDEWEIVPDDQTQAPRQRDWTDTINALAGNALEGLTFNFSNELGLVSDEQEELNKEFAQDNPKTAIAANIAGGLALPVGRAKALAKAPGLFSAIAGAGPKTAAATGLGRVAQGAGYGAAYGGLSGAGAGEGAEDRLTKGAIGAGLGGALGGSLSGLVNALMGKAPSLSKGEALLSKRLKDVPEDVLQGTEATLRQADQPVFLPEALGLEDFTRQAKTIANSADTKNISQAAIKARYDQTPDRLNVMLDDIAPYSKPAEASGKLKEASEKIAQKLNENRAIASQATYGPVYQQTKNVSQELAQDMLASENAQRLANSIRKSREFMNKPDTDTEFLHAVKSALQNEAKVTDNASKARGLRGDADYIKARLNENVPGLSDADKMYSGLSENIDEITNDSLLGTLLNKESLNVGNFGKKLLDSRIDPKEIKKLVKDLGNEGEDLVLSAVRAELSDQVANKVGDKNTISVFDKQALKDRLTDILGESKASKMIKRIDEESLIADGTRSYNLGSKTQGNIEDAGLEDYFRNAYKYYGNKGLSALSMDVLGNTLGKLTNPSINTLQDEARIIFSKDEAADAIARILANTAKNKKNQENFSYGLPLITNTTKAITSRNIPVIEIKNSNKND